MQPNKMPKPENAPVKNSSVPLKPELKTQKSEFKSYIALSLLVVSLAAGGLYASKNMLVQNQKVEAVVSAKAEFVKSVLALSDDDYHDKDLPVIRDDQHHRIEHDGHFHDAPIKVQARAQASVSHEAILKDVASPVEVSAPNAAAPDLAAIEEQERINAERTENMGAQISSTIESNYVALSQEAELKRQRAREAIRIEREKQKKIVATPSVEPVLAQMGLFDGVLTKCRIPGHDVHWISHQGDILKHELVESPLSGNALAAREYINKLGPTTVVMIYKKGFEVYDGVGNLVQTGNRE